MAMNQIQFQQGLSLPQFIELYGTEEKCESSLKKARWPDGFRCPRIHAQEHGLIHGRRHKRYQCRGAVDIKPPLRLERSWRQLSYL